MSPTHPFTTSIISLLFLILPFTTATQIKLHPYPHLHQPHTTNINLLYNKPTILTLSLHPLHPSEFPLSLTHTLSHPSTISLTSTNHTLKPVVTLRQIGITTFSITLHTTNPFHTYKTFINASVPGFTIGYPTNVLPASVPDINLGTYENWLSISQLAFPLLIHPPPNTRTRNLFLRVSVISHQTIDPKVCRLPIRSSPNNTRFFRNSVSTIRGVVFPPHCGIALSTDNTWLILRLKPYRVGNYKFTVRFQFPRRNGSSVVGNTIQFLYEPLVPPVLITKLAVILDPFGAELLQVPVENALSPPRKSPLSYHQTVLKLFQAHVLVGKLRPRDMLRVGNTSRHILRFRTNEIKGRPGKLGVVLETGGRNAVVDPRYNVSITLSLRRMAVLDGCTRGLVNTRFLKVVIRVPYNRTTFTEWKNGLMKRAVQGFFPQLGHGVRLVDVVEGHVTYAVLVSQVSWESDLGDLGTRIREFHLAMRNGSFASAVYAWKDDIIAQEVVYMNKSLCTVFPHLVFSASAREIHGEQLLLLPLYTSFPIVFLFLIAMLFARNGFAKSGITVSRYWSNIFEGDTCTSKTAGFDKPRKRTCDTSETCYAPICTYPCEAREKFARRHGFSDKITLENVTDSDLDSSVESEPEEGLGRSVGVITKFCRGCWGLGDIWRTLRGHEPEVEISGRTGSTSKSPTIYIERVSYNRTSQTAAYC